MFPLAEDHGSRRCSRRSGNSQHAVTLRRVDDQIMAIFNPRWREVDPEKHACNWGDPRGEPVEVLPNKSFEYHSTLGVEQGDVVCVA